MPLSKISALVVAVALAPALAPSAFAKVSPKTEAKQHYTSGMAAYNLEDYDGAMKEFEAAYRLVPDASFLYNIAQCHRMAKRHDKALAFYKRYLSQSPETPNRAEVERLISDEEKAIAAAQAPLPVAAPAPVKPPPAVPIVEPETSTGYMSNVVVDDKVYTAVGLGLRKVWGVKVYGMAMYVEDAPARAQMKSLAARVGGRDLAHLTASDYAQSFLLLGDFGKIGHLKFVRDVSAKDVQKSYRDSLHDELKGASPAVEKDIERFVALFGRDVKRGDECVIRTTAAGDVFVEAGGYRMQGPRNPQLAQAIWSIWLGQHPISTDLRKQLVNRIDALAK